VKEREERFSHLGRRLMRSKQIRRIFFVELFRLLRVVSPILSGVLSAMVGPGLLIGYIEGWRVDDALYFTFVTGLTIGYGDLTPRHVVSRLLAVVIGFAGILLTGLVAAISVEALRATARHRGD
jgi:hypothetical protein